MNSFRKNVLVHRIFVLELYYCYVVKVAVCTIKKKYAKVTVTDSYKFHSENRKFQFSKMKNLFSTIKINKKLS